MGTIFFDEYTVSIRMDERILGMNNGDGLRNAVTTVNITELYT